MKKIIIPFIAYCLLFIPLSASAQIILPNPLKFTTFTQIIESIAFFISGVVGSLAVLMFIWAGILFLTSAGNETQLGKAKKTLLYAVAGLAIAILGAALIALIRWILGGG